MYKGLEELNYTSRYIFLGYGIFSFLLIILIIVDMSLHRWFVYCFWEFGLFYGGKLYDEIALHDEYTIFDVHSDACGSVKLVYEEVCPNLCDYLYRFAGAGGAMIFLGIICLIFHLILMWAHCVKASQSKLKIKYFWVIQIIPTLLYLLGSLLYIAILNPIGIDDTDQSSTSKSVESKPRDFDLGPGFWMAISLVGIQAAQATFGFFMTRSGFKPE